MSWIELNLRVECPHCGNEQSECAEFRTDEMDMYGGTSGYYKVECTGCYKDFWFNARCNIECELENVHKKKPKNV